MTANHTKTILCDDGDNTVVASDTFVFGIAVTTFAAAGIVVTAAAVCVFLLVVKGNLSFIA